MKQGELGVHKLLDRIPVVCNGPPLWLAEYSNVRIVSGMSTLAREMDTPKPMDLTRIAVVEDSQQQFHRFPVISLVSPEDKEAFSIALFERYEQVESYAFSQVRIAEEILSDTVIDTIILMLVDGLSYDDCPKNPFIQPCLVNGPTITRVGFRNIVGRPPLAVRLYRAGFKRRRGFSYWDRKNELTNELFAGFDPASQVTRVVEFDQIYRELADETLHKTFVQIVTAGLDTVAHISRERPLVGALVRRILEEYVGGLQELLLEKGLSGIIYMVSDHGILWKDWPGQPCSLRLIPDAKATSHRYSVGTRIVPHTRRFTAYGQEFAVLPYPLVFRGLRRNEWGTHGGISYYESVVPFLKMEVL